jgi:hypothetical protein
MNFDLRTASTIMVGIIIFAVVLLIGDYLGYKIGRMKLATYTLFTVLGLIIVFAIFAVIRSFVVNG